MDKTKEKINSIIDKYPIGSKIEFGDKINGRVSGYTIQENNYYVDVTWWNDGQLNSANLSIYDIDGEKYD